MSKDPKEYPRQNDCLKEKLIRSDGIDLYEDEIRALFSQTDEDV